MKNTLLALACLFSSLTVIAGTQVVFDPATYPADSLPTGMTIDTIDGTPYLQVVLDGWNSSVKLMDAVIVDPGRTHFRCVAKYSVGSSGFDISQINTFLKLTNSDFSVEIGASGQGSSSEFKKYMVPISTEDTVANFQMAGQETSGWTAVTGDTLWIGKVDIITYDPKAVFDPGSIDPATLDSSMAIVNIDGTDYCRIVLNSWSSSIPVDPYVITAASTDFTAMAKYAVGSSGFDITQINTFLKLANSDFSVEIGAAGQASSSDFMKYTVAITADDTVGNLQIAGQETSGWTAVTGDTLWVGKVTLEDNAAPTAPANLAADASGSDISLSWDASTDNAGVASYIISQDGTPIDTVTGTSATVSGLANGDYTFGVTAMDKSGNKSAESTVDATVGSSAIIDPVANAVSIYPNPVTNGTVTIALQNTAQVTIFDVNGKVVYNNLAVERSVSLSTSNFAAGVYYVKIKNTNSTQVEKLIIK